MKEVIDLNGEVITVPNSTVVKSVDGIHYLLTPAEEIEEATKVATYNAKAISRNAKIEITRLESEVTQRRLREATLGIDNGWLANQDSLIAIERAKL